jgi:hypothetical protein
MPRTHYLNSPHLSKTFTEAVNVNNAVDVGTNILGTSMPLKNYIPTSIQATASPMAEAALWRYRASKALHIWQQALEGADLLTPSITDDIKKALQKLSKSRYTVAIVAEVSRGKSELINALLFSEYGRRIVPVGAGRTTMCPIEFLHEPNTPPYLELLPIHTRAPSAEQPLTHIYDLYNIPSVWQRYALDGTDADSLALAMQKIGESQTISRTEANRLGIQHAPTDAKNIDDTADTLEVPLWRYARMNLHHPLLENGLSLLDTPGLNALGHESDLTYEILPHADAVLFVLGADTGVSHSEQQIWEQHLNAFPKNNVRLLLNKTDTLHDPLRSDHESQAALTDQVERCAKAMKIPKEHVFTVSAQQALIGRITHNQSAFDHSGLSTLEKELSANLLEKCQLRIKHTVLHTLIVNYHALSETLSSEALALQNQLDQLGALTGSKDRLYAVHAYTSDTKKRQNIEESLTNKLTRSLHEHVQKLIDMLSTDDIAYSFGTALAHCHSDRLNVIQQDLSITLAAAQMRFLAVQAELQNVQTTVVNSLRKLNKQASNTAIDAEQQTSFIKSEAPNTHTNTLSDITDSITKSLPTSPNISSALLEIKRLAQRNKPGAASLFPTIKMLHLTRFQRKKHETIITTAMDRCIHLSKTLQTDILLWFDALHQHVEHSQAAQRHVFEKRNNALLRMEDAQTELKASCTQLNELLRLTLERKNAVDRAYVEAQTILKIPSNLPLNNTTTLTTTR